MDKVTRQSVLKLQPFWRERSAEVVSNQGPSAYQPKALPLGQTGSHPSPAMYWWYLYHFCVLPHITLSVISFFPSPVMCCGYLYHFCVLPHITVSVISVFPSPERLPEGRRGEQQPGVDAQDVPLPAHSGGQPAGLHSDALRSIHQHHPPQTRWRGVSEWGGADDGAQTDERKWWDHFGVVWSVDVPCLCWFVVPMFCIVLVCHAPVLYQSVMAVLCVDVLYPCSVLCRCIKVLCFVSKCCGHALYWCVVSMFSSVLVCYAHVLLSSCVVSKHYDAGVLLLCLCSVYVTSILCCQQTPWRWRPTALSLFSVC